MLCSALEELEAAQVRHTQEVIERAGLQSLFSLTTEEQPSEGKVVSLRDRYGDDKSA